MTLGLLSLFLVGALLVRWRGHHRTAAGMVAFGVALVLALGAGPMSKLMLSGLQDPVARAPSITWSQRSAIVVLGAGLTEGVRGHTSTVPVWSYGRLVRVEELFAECISVRNDCVVIVSGGAGSGNNREADAYGQELERMGIPATSIILERESLNTWDNAQRSTAILKRESRTAPLIVTSALHVRRAVIYFNAFGANAIGVASDFLEPETTWYPTALNIAMADLALHEYVGIARFHVYEALDAND